PAELRVAFDQPLHADVPRAVMGPTAAIEFGEYVSAGDRFEKLKPPYAVVQQQDATPHGHLRIHSASLDDAGRTLVLKTEPHSFLTRYAVTLPGIRGKAESGPGATIDLDYDLTYSSQAQGAAAMSQEMWRQPLAWAPKVRASAGTDSRTLGK